MRPFLSGLALYYFENGLFNGFSIQPVFIHQLLRSAALSKSILGGHKFLGCGQVSRQDACHAFSKAP